jgi:GAF domain
MNKIADSNSKIQSNQVFYIPLKEFRDKVSEVGDFYYHSKLSFKPVFEKIRQTKEKKVKGFSDEFIFLEDFENQLLKLSDSTGAKDRSEKTDVLIRLLFPALFFEGQMGFIGTPFTKEFTFMTPAMNEMFDSGKWELKMKASLMEPRAMQTVLQAGSVILEKLYDRKEGMVFSEKMCIRHKETLLEKYFQINIITDFIKVVPQKPLRKLNAKQIFRLLNGWDNKELWLKCFPPENFKFEGIVIGYLTDVTDVEIMSQLKVKLLEESNSNNPDEILKEMTSAFRSFLGMPEITFGSLQSLDMMLQMSQMGSSWTVVGDANFLASLPGEAFGEGVYGKVLEDDEPVIIGDLKKLPEPSDIDKILIEKGYRSLLLAPLFDNDGKSLGAFELASKKPYQFSKMTLIKLKDAISFFELGTNRWLKEIENQVNLFIQQQYTSIHPSVEWKFIEVSKKYLWSKAFNNEEVVLDPVVFKNIYPLYAQADIVGSSTLRNKSIESDLIDNLERVKKVIKACRKNLAYDLLEIYLSKVEEDLERLKKGAFISSDESQIVDLLNREIHPLLRQIQGKYDEAPHTLLEKYFAYLDPKLNIVYRKRKAYEQSVGLLNRAISDFIEKEDEKKQKILPHFFEKYTTDGVEYNIYIGESLLQNGGFSGYYLKDFRLWQLITMCEVTRLVKRISTELPVPLTTAQLVFVFNNHLSIRFHMDEKQFEVDGAYNVRYEILKKRIDKAVIKGTGERLTQSGKIATVWLNEIDKREYLEYLKHLQKKGFITNEIEELELEKLQGAEGLKALRVTVVDE